MNRFIHFGCWNNTRAEGCLADVMENLNRYTEIPGNTPNFISIVGDNYYPEKKVLEIDGKKRKQNLIHIDRLHAGFDLLPKKTQIYMLLGNHDLQTNITGEAAKFYINDIDTPERVNDCTILKTEESISSEIGRNIDFVLFQALLLDNQTLLLMIDTSMYSEDVNEFIPCYNYFLQSSYNVDGLREYQNKLIMDALEQYSGLFNHLIISGHHPITGLKQKSEKIILLNDIPHFYSVLINIYDLIGDNAKYYYLCADLHLFQEGIIQLNVKENKQMKIRQYITGTGGTKLDNDIVTEKPNEMMEFSNGSYKMIRYERKCGFLDCITTADGPEFNFISISSRGGKKRRRRINKSKKTRKKSRPLKKRGKKTKKTKRKYK